MIFSNGAYYSPMDREYVDGDDEPAPRMEKPVLGVDELGVTVPEKHPVTGGNILQNVESAIRMGASKLQISMSVQHTNALGGRAKAYGKEVRESIRELAKANEVEIEGVEMPTSSMSNLSGWDPQGRGIIEQSRQQSLAEVKETIKFVADIGGGGGVDVWSQEFARSIHDAPWNQTGKWAGSFEAYEEEQKYSSTYVVDQRSGRVQEIPTGQPIFEPVFKTADREQWGVDVDGNRHKIRKGDWITKDGQYIDPKKPHHLLMRFPEWDDQNSEFKVKALTWDQIKQNTKEYNERLGLTGDDAMVPEEYAIQSQLDNQWIQRKGQSLYYSSNYKDHIKQLEGLQKSLKHYEKLEKEIPEEEMWRIMEDDPIARYSKWVRGGHLKPTEVIQKEIDDLWHRLKHIHEASASADAQAMEVAEQKKAMVSLRKYALSKSVQSYADAGLAALDETMNNPNVTKPIHVGPESGWPQAYGGHPMEFVELIKKSRDEMVQRLIKERGYSKQKAQDLAKTHISGCFDTSHVGMWLTHFKAKEGESEEERIDRFNDWYREMVHKMAEEDVVGSVQAVDSTSGAHSHLPPGQGIFPVVEAVEILKEHGFSGWVVSEGHEEEGFQQGRMLMESWRAFGSDVGGSYFAATPGRAQWGEVGETYFGHVNPPNYIVGSYRPSEDWVFWSGVPLE